MYEKHADENFQQCTTKCIDEKKRKSFKKLEIFKNTLFSTNISLFFIFDYLQYISFNNILLLDMD